MENVAWYRWLLSTPVAYWCVADTQLNPVPSLAVPIPTCTAFAICPTSTLKSHVTLSPTARVSPCFPYVCGAIHIPPAATPVPVKLTVVGLPVAVSLCAMLIVAEWLPAAVGAYVTSISSTSSAATVSVVGLALKHPAFAPLNVTPLTVKSASP